MVLIDFEVAMSAIQNCCWSTVFDEYHSVLEPGQRYPFTEKFAWNIPEQAQVSLGYITIKLSFNEYVCFIRKPI